MKVLLLIKWQTVKKLFTAYHKLMQSTAIILPLCRCRQKRGLLHASDYGNLQYRM